MSKFEISKRKNEEFQFNLIARNGEIVLTSEGYTTKANCKKGIESVRKNSPDDEKYERKVSSNNKPYFNLKAANGEVIGVSQLYENEADREHGIAVVKQIAPDAEVVDLTPTIEHHSAVDTESEEVVSTSMIDVSENGMNTVPPYIPVEATEKISKAYDNVPPSDDKPKKGSWGWLKYLLLLLLLLLILFFVWKACSNTGETTAVTSTEPVVEETIVEEVVAPVEKVPTELTLPNGVKLNAYKGGIEDQMIAFLQSDEYKNATADDLKDKWFNFDNIEFKFGSGTELTEASQPQLQNVVAILKYFKDAKVKVGAYTDKVGSEEVNMKLSQERANTVKTILGKDGLGKQVVEAEGYGDKFAKHDKDAPDNERALDRIIALRFIK